MKSEVKIQLLSGILILSIFNSMESFAGTGPQPFPASPIGGGPNYHAQITVDGNTTTVTTTAEFEQALSSATTGGNLKVFIPSGTTLNLKGAPNSYTIPDNMTIFSDRGLNGSLGGKLKYSQYDNGTASFAVTNVGSNVTLSGLQIEGPSGENDPTQNFLAYGFKIKGAKNFKVLNNDISAWPGAAIAVDAFSDVEVMYNVIHNNRRAERGYGIVVQGVDSVANINYNLFYNNRHSIAGAGKSGEEWYANYNIQLKEGNGHAFDMHQYGAIGGKHVEAHNNLMLMGSTCWGHKPSFNIRGVPEDGSAIITGNWFTTPPSFIDCGKRAKKTVAGLAGAVPREHILKQYNSFNAGVDWKQNSPVDCEVSITGSYSSATIPVHCTGYILAR